MHLEVERPVQLAAMARIASARLLGGPCQAEHRAGQNFANLHLCLLANRCFVDAARVLLGDWNVQCNLGIKTGRLVRSKRPFLEKRGKAPATSVAPALGSRLGRDAFRKPVQIFDPSTAKHDFFSMLG